MPDTGPSRLLSLTTPTTLDLDQNTVSALFAATVEDPDGIRQVTVYYDRPLATESGAYEFQIIHGYGDDWADGNHFSVALNGSHSLVGADFLL